MPSSFLKQFLIIPIVASFIVSCAPYTSEYFTAIPNGAVKPTDSLYKNVSLGRFHIVQKNIPPAFGAMGYMGANTLPDAVRAGLRDSLELAGMLSTEGDADVLVSGRLEKADVAGAGLGVAKVTANLSFNIEYFGETHDFRVAENAEFPTNSGRFGPTLGDATSLGFESLIEFLKTLSR